MRLDVREILHRPGERVHFSETLDVSGEDFSGTRADAVSVSGEVRNEAGLLRLRMELETVLHCVCARCAAEFDRPFRLPVEQLLAETLEGEEDEILLLEDGTVDTGELAREALILHMDIRTLCRADCRGLCPGCGANLNVEACRCRRAADPRWAKLASLLNDEES